jgi:hypothetical protein
LRKLTEKFPTITELHNQLVEVRHELSRQKYVNQVLWRKLNTLIDIHGSNTRNELAIELANYQDELAKLKSQQNRTNDARSVILNAHSRSSSGLLLSIYCLVLHTNSCFFNILIFNPAYIVLLLTHSSFFFAFVLISLSLSMKIRTKYKFIT